MPVVAIFTVYTHTIGILLSPILIEFGEFGEVILLLLISTAHYVNFEIISN